MGYRARAIATLAIPATEAMMQGLIRIANACNERNPVQGGWSVEDVVFVRLNEAIASEIYDIENKQGRYDQKYQSPNESEVRR